MKKIAVVAALVLGVAAITGAMRARDWGANFGAFIETCAELGGVLNGKSYGATCSFEGGVATVPAGSQGWTIDLAEGTVATWLGGGKVTETRSAGTVVVACHDDSGERMPLWNDRCVRQ